MTITSINFATTNSGKIKEAEELLKIRIVPCGLKIDEVQSLDPIEVTKAKARDYFKQLNQAILVEDVSLKFLALNGLPGPYINDFSKALGNEGLIKLIANENNREAVAQTTLVYIDELQVAHGFEGVISGTIAREVLGDNGFGWDPIFIPNGFAKTFAQMTDEEKNKCSMRAKAFSKFREWLEEQNA